jgi:tRNA A-37 threonylcarbamoyl transferase component Bud32
MSDSPNLSDASNAMPRISGYRLLRVIGHGGMSTVYLAEQESLGRKVALKVMLPEALADEVSRRRFENEARTIARLDHPHIVGIFEVGRTHDGLPYYAMPYLARGHLGQRIARQQGQTHDQAGVKATLRSLLGALDYAHAHGVVHRDVKAENVLFDDAGRPLLADFGIALRKGNSPRVTMAGLAVGSTAYMPPEQARGEEVDSRADLYSVGVLAWEMLTGRLPFAAGDALSMAMMHAQDPVPRLPRELRHWQRLIDKAMTKTPATRFRSAQQMLEALDRIGQRGFLPGDGLRARLRGWPMPTWIALGVAAVALLGAGLHYGAGERADALFRGSQVAASADTAPADDLIAAMLRPPPESPAQRWIDASARQITQRQLTAPAGDNAYDSALAAWRADRQHSRMDATLGAVIGALGEEMARHLRDGDDPRAGDYRKRAEALARQTAPASAPALAALRKTAASALQDRFAEAERAADRGDALAVAGLATTFTGDAALARSLRARADRIARPGQAVAGDPAGVIVVGDGDARFAAMRHAVGRADYTRFANATGRAPAACREKLSPLRLLAPRSWRAPGFEQNEAQPVVCVSWGDADAYAHWLSQRSGHRYRLPNAVEWRALADKLGGQPAADARALTEWLRDCGTGAGCRQRIATGASWRGAKGARPLDPARGYDDVGFRLVREL